MWKLKLIIIFAVLMSIPLAMAIDYNQYCLNTSHLRKQVDFVSCEDSTCNTYNFSQDFRCQFNCSSITNKCNNDPYSIEFVNFGTSTILATAISTFVFIYLAVKITKWHGVLQVLFMVAGLGMIILTFSIARVFAGNVGATATVTNLLDVGITTSTYIFWFFLIYFMLNFLYTSLRSFFPKKKKSEVIGEV